ncbi:E6 protein [Spatholobus suberectus]|nr:E6 protein [Spatholobus suberectus]
MAPSSNYISFLFLATLLLPLQITARDSQFFSKVTHFNNNNVKETELPNKEAPETNKPEQQPAFIPETENSYGLYGHDESNQLPSTTPTTTTTSYHPYKTEFEDTNKYSNNKYFNNEAYNNKKYYNKDAYGGNQYKLSDTKYTEEGYNNNKYYNSYQNDNQKYYHNNDAANGKYYYNNHNNYNANNNRYSYNTNAANNRYNGEKQGMSDTRFLEGGKYFHDIYAEKYNPTNYGDSSRGVNTNNWYNNNRGGNYNGYQNQEEFEDEQENYEP